MSPFSIRIDRYQNSRHWAIWLNDELLAVTVYKKGALAIQATLLGLRAAATRTPLHAV